MGRNGKLDGFFSVIVFASAVVIPHIFPLCDGFVGLQRAEARLITNYKKMYVIIHYYGVKR